MTQPSTIRSTQRLLIGNGALLMFLGGVAGFGFLFVLALLLLPLSQMTLKGFLDRQRSGQFILSFSLAASTLLLLASSHYFTDMLIGATLGAYSSYRYGRKNASHRPPDLRPSAPRYPDLHQAMP